MARYSQYRTVAGTVKEGWGALGMHESGVSSYRTMSFGGQVGVALRCRFSQIKSMVHRPLFAKKSHPLPGWQKDVRIQRKMHRL